MSGLDWLILGSYLAGMIAMSVYIGRSQKSSDDYYVGGRSLPWWAIGISTMATQSSAISFISKPGFVALKEGGGLTWLQYELAVPLAMIVIITVLVPFFRKLQLVSVYEYLELRYDASIRYLVSAVFLISRGLAAGAVIYATAIVLSVCLELDLWITILLIGAVTVIYDTIGGITAVVYSDVVQLILLVGGVILCIVVAVEEVGSLEKVFAVLPADRWRALDFSSGINDGSATPFWGIFIGGFFLYISYYGTDQSQVQRELSAESSAGTRRSLIFNGLGRFPLTVLYMFLGVAIHAVYLQSPDLQALVTAEKPDFLVPQYIMLHLPSGVRALLFAAILAAAMSSIDSVLNSLSAATMRDFINRDNQFGERSLLIGKFVTLGWGAFITGFAFYVPLFEDTLVEVVNKIGSAFYGPIAAAFLVGVLSKRIGAKSIFGGIISGVGVNLILWRYYGDIFWMWWNFIGCVVSVLVAWMVSLVLPANSAVADEFTLGWKALKELERDNIGQYAGLVLYTALMFGLLYWVSSYAE